MSAALAPLGEDSPFEGIRQLDDQGQEFWSARDLMPLLGYDKWQNFFSAIERARTAVDVQEMDVSSHFTGASKVTNSGPNQVDVHLSRYGAYHVALSGDPRKPEVAAAIRYFVVKTREAEIVQREIPQTYAAALRAAADAEERAELAEAMKAEAEGRVLQLVPRAVAAEAAEFINAGQSLWDLKPAIKQRLGLRNVNDASKAARQIGVYFVLDQKHTVGAEWRDIVFASENPITGREDGTVRVRPGKQEELLERMSRAWARLMTA